MSDVADDILRLRAMIEHLRAVRDRTCEPKRNTNPRYHALSSAVSGIGKAIADMQAEDA